MKAMAEQSEERERASLEQAQARIRIAESSARGARSRNGRPEILFEAEWRHEWTARGQKISRNDWKKSKGSARLSSEGSTSWKGTIVCRASS